MSLKRYAAKRDQSEAQIVAALRKAGADVLLLDPFDALVLYQGRITMLECKTPNRKTPRKTESQKDLIARGWPIRFVSTPSEALAVIGDT